MSDSTWASLIFIGAGLISFLPGIIYSLFTKKNLAEVGDRNPEQPVGP